MGNIVVVNKKDRVIPVDGQIKVYIGRAMSKLAGSPLGNPFKVMPGEPNKIAIGKYETYIKNEIRNGNQTIINELYRLYDIYMSGKVLLLECWCAPKACHGDVIKELLLRKEAYERKQK